MPIHSPPTIVTHMHLIVWAMDHLVELFLFHRYLLVSFPLLLVFAV